MSSKIINQNRKLIWLLSSTKWSMQNSLKTFFPPNLCLIRFSRTSCTASQLQRCKLNASDQSSRASHALLWSKLEALHEPEGRKTSSVWHACVYLSYNTCKFQKQDYEVVWWFPCSVTNQLSVAASSSLFFTHDYVNPHTSEKKIYLHKQSKHDVRKLASKWISW